LWSGVRAFEADVVATLDDRYSSHASLIELHALTKMACSWFVTAAHIYLVEGRRSLVRTFDEVVSICVQSGRHDLEVPASQGGKGARTRRGR
jgi:hypothetical protein